MNSYRICLLPIRRLVGVPRSASSRTVKKEAVDDASIGSVVDISVVYNVDNVDEGDERRNLQSAWCDVNGVSLLPPGTIPSTQSGGTSVTVNSIPTAIHTATTPSSNAATPSTSCRLPGRASKGCPTLRRGVPRAFPRKVPGPRISGTQTMIRPGRRRAARTPCHCRTGTSTTVPTTQPRWSAAIKPTPASRAARASGSSRTLPPNLPRA